MTIFLLKESGEYTNCYFIEEYATREEAVKHLEPYSYCACKFIEGEELELTLANKDLSGLDKKIFEQLSKVTNDK